MRFSYKADSYILYGIDMYSYASNFIEMKLLGTFLDARAHPFSCTHGAGLGPSGLPLGAFFFVSSIMAHHGPCMLTWSIGGVRGLRNFLLGVCMFATRSSGRARSLSQSNSAGAIRLQCGLIYAICGANKVDEMVRSCSAVKYKLGKI